MAENISEKYEGGFSKANGYYSLYRAHITLANIAKNKKDKIENLTNSIEALEKYIMHEMGIESRAHLISAKIRLGTLLQELGIIAKEKRVIFEKEAISYEAPSATSLDEFRRKIRIMIGAIGAITSQSIKSILFQLISHKILRWAGGLFMLILLISNFFVCHPFLILQIIFYSFAVSGFIFETQNLKLKTKNYFYAPYYFCLTNIAQIVGFIKYIKDERSPEWGKVERSTW